MWGPKFLRDKGGKFQYKIKCNNSKPRVVERNMKILRSGISVGKGYDKKMEKTKTKNVIFPILPWVSQFYLATKTNIKLFTPC